MTKKLAAMEAKYRKQLKKCGFRSWRAANQRRFELIQSRARSDEFEELQKLSRYYVAYKTNDSGGRMIRRLTAALAKLQIKLAEVDAREGGLKELVP